MCEDCFCEEDMIEADGTVAPITPELVAAMRMIEADLPGAPVPETAWPVFTGEASGALAWTHLERLSRSREAAALLLRYGVPA